MDTLAGLTQKFKSWYDDFLPIWKWKLHEGKKRETYSEVLNICRKSQYVLLSLAVFTTLYFNRSRQMLSWAIFRESPLLFLMEFTITGILGYFIGMKRIPANYVSFVIIKCFVFMEKDLAPDVHKFGYKVIEDSQYYGKLSVVTYNTQQQKPNLMEAAVRTYLRNAVFLSLAVILIWILHKFTKIDFSKHEKSAGVLTTIATGTAAALLVATFSFDDFPEFKEHHRVLCEIWVILAVSTFIYIMMFLCGCLLKTLRSQKLPLKQFTRDQWECLIFLLVLHVMVRYLPVIHKGFVIKYVINHSLSRMFKTLIPDPVLDIISASGGTAFRVFEKASEAHS